MNSKFDLYSSEYRQKTIVLLGMHNTGDEVTARHLARFVAAKSGELEIKEKGGDDYKAILIELLHIHLPKLEDHGVIEYDQEEKSVTVTNETLESASEFMEMKAAI